jgi:hypothetical protein
MTYKAETILRSRVIGDTILMKSQWGRLATCGRLAIGLKLSDARDEGQRKWQK